MTDEMRAREEAICKAALVKAYKEKAWKSYRHEDGEYCFGGGWFIVGIDTPEGSYTYHYENKYWDMFDCIDLPRAKHWDGHTEADAETRLMSLNPERKDGDEMTDDTISRQAAIDAIMCEPTDAHYPSWYAERLKRLPSAQPTDAEIQRMQDIEQAALEKAYECGKQDAIQWIPCSERLPEDEEEVIVSVRDDSGDNTLDYSSCGWYACAGDFWVVDNEPNYHVVAWMPLPKPWKGGEE